MEEIPDYDFKAGAILDFPPIIGLFLWWNDDILDALMGGIYNVKRVNSSIMERRKGFFKSTTTVQNINYTDTGLTATVSTVNSFLGFPFSSINKWVLGYRPGSPDCSVDLQIKLTMLGPVKRLIKPKLQKILDGVWDDSRVIGERILRERDAAFPPLTEPDQIERIDELLGQLIALDLCNQLEPGDARDKIFAKINKAAASWIGVHISIDEHKKELSSLLDEVRIAADEFLKSDVSDE